MDLVERVARAICREDGYDPDAKWIVTNADGTSLTVLAWQTYQGHAKAAIEAMGSGRIQDNDDGSATAD